MKLISKETIQKHTQTSGARNEIDEILAPVLLEQRIYGQQILDPSWSCKKYALNHIFCTFLTTYVLTGTIYIIQNNKDMVLLSEAVLTLIVILEYEIKLVCLILYHTTFREIYVTAKSSLFDLVQETSPDRAMSLHALLRKITKVQLASVIIPTLMYLTLALWSWYGGTRVPLSRSTSTLMPQSSPYHEIGLVLHLNFFIMNSISVLGADLWFIVFSCILCEACDSAVDILQVEKVAKETGNSYANRLNQALGRFYCIHVRLMAYLNTLNVMYKWQVLASLGGSLGITCVYLLVITETTNWQLTSVMMSITTELFAYNVMGERIKSKASNMNMALLNFDWTSLKIKDKKNYAIIMCYMNKDFSIRTAIGVDLSLLTLSSIYKASYQMFAVLNTMK